MGFETVTPPSRPTLRPLTGLRFVAALGVLLFHYWAPCLTGAPAVVWNINRAGHVGVSLFFVLSGFILAYTYLNEDGRLTTNRGKFWMARFARVYPLYVFSLLLDWPHFYLKWVGPTLHEKPLATAGLEIGAVSASCLGLLQSWTAGIAYLWNAPAWSVSVEAFFYAVFPFVTATVLVRDRRSMYRLVAGLWVAALLPAVVAVVGEARFTDRESQIVWDHSFGASPLLRLPEFLIGVVAGQQFVRAMAGPQVAPGGWVRYGVWLSGGVILVVLACSPLIPQRLLHNGLLAPAFAVLVYSLARQPGPVGAVLGSRVLVLLGEASFAVYILQVPLHALARAVARYAGGGDMTSGVAVETTPVFIVTFSVFVILAAVAALFVIERPARRWLRQRFDSREKHFPVKRLRDGARADRFDHPGNGSAAARAEAVRAVS